MSWHSREGVTYDNDEIYSIGTNAKTEIKLQNVTLVNLLIGFALVRYVG